MKHFGDDFYTYEMNKKLKTAKEQLQSILDEYERFEFQKEVAKIENEIANGTYNLDSLDLKIDRQGLGDFESVDSESVDFESTDFESTDSKSSDFHASDDDVKNAYDKLKKYVLSELDAFLELQLKSTVFLFKHIFEIATAQGKELIGNNFDEDKKYIEEENKNPALKYFRSVNYFDEWLDNLAAMSKYTENDWKRYVATELKCSLEKNIPDFLQKIYASVYKNNAVLNGVLKTLGTEEVAGIKKAAKENNVPSVFLKAISNLYEFDDIVRLNDRATQLLLYKINWSDLEMALKGAKDKTKEKFFRNMSKPAAEKVKKDMEWLGSIRKSDCIAAQDRILCVMQQLAEQKEIEISHNSDNELIM